MQLIYRNRRRSVSTSIGIGNLTLAEGDGAWTHISGDDFDTNFFAYTVVAGTQWETGIGHLDTGALVRDYVLDSSEGGSGVESQIDFGAGEKEVFCTFVAEVADGVSEICEGGVAKPGRATSASTEDDTPITREPPCAENPPFSAPFNAARFGVGELYVLAKSSADKAKAWRITFMIAPDGLGGAALFGKAIDVIAETESLTWDVDFSLSGVDGINQDVTLTGEAATTIEWTIFAAVKAGQIGTSPI